MNTILAAGTGTLPMVEPETTTKARILPPYNVILENDPDHSMEFVIDVLRKVFGYPNPKAYQLMMTAHESGEAVVWTGAKEVAELKKEQMETFHEIRQRDNKDLGPLGVRIEPTE